MPAKPQDKSVLEQLQEENLLLYTAISSSVTGVIITDNREPDNPIIYCNRAFEELSGYSREEIIGRNCRFLQGNDRGQEERKQLKDAVKNKKSVKVEIRNYRKNGNLFINELTISPVKNADDEITHFIGIQNDVSNRKKLETQLKNERNHLESKIKERTKELENIRDFQSSIIETIRESLLVLNAEMQVISANRYFYKTFRATAEETEGRILFELGSGQWDIPALKDVLYNVLPHNNPFEDFTVEHDFPLLGRRTMILNARQVELEGSYRNRILLAIEDATDRVEIDRRKDDFLSLASHELKTPITSIKGFTQIAQRIIPNDNIKLKELFKKILKHVDHLTELITNMLDVSKIKTGRILTRKENFDFDTMVREGVETVSASDPSYKIVLNGESKAEFHGDRVRLEQVVTNLLTNAVKYSPQNKTIVVYLNQVADVLKVSVTDNGIGINLEDQEKVFEQFFRVDDVQTKYPGMGIGLYFCSQVIQMHNGHLWVDSEIGKGSTFSFTLPVTQIIQQ